MASPGNGNNSSALGGGTSSSSSSSAAAASSTAHPDLSATSPRNIPAPKASTTTSVSTNVAAASALSEPSSSSSATAGYPSSTSAAALASLGANASPTDVLLTLPPPILRLLVISSPFISFLTTTTQLLTWTHPNRYAPFFLPVLWTALCLGGERLSRYGLNGLLLSILGIGWIVRKGAERRRLRNETAVIANKGVAATANKDVLTTSSTIGGGGREGSNVRTLALATSSQPAIQVLTPSALNLLLAESTILAKHIQILHRTFSPLFKPFTWQDPDVSWATIYFLMNSYPFYLVLTTLVPLNLIILVLGLVALLWEAPWFAVVRRSLWKSALVRKTARVGIRVLSGGAPSMRFSSIRGPKGVGLQHHWDAFKHIWRETKADVLVAQNGARTTSRGTQREAATTAKSTAKVATSSLEKYEHDIVEVQYMFTIFENQRWWIGLEWTQALLPNERPSWSDPTHSPCSPPGSFALPPPTTVYLSSSKKRTFTWKWSDQEWRIRGTAGIMISPSTIGANPNPVNISSNGVASGTAAATAASMGDKAAKDLKDVMGSLGDWKSILANRRDNSEKERRSSAIAPGAAEDKPASAIPSSASANHTRKGSSTSFFGDSFNAFVGAIDGKSVIKDSPASPIDMQGKKADVSESTAESSRQTIDPKEDPDLLGHPTRIDDVAVSDGEFKTWEVDSQGWVYSDNQWEKTTSKGGMGRYTRRRAWVRRAIVVEQVEDITVNEATSSLPPPSVA